MSISTVRIQNVKRTRSVPPWGHVWGEQCLAGPLAMFTEGSRREADPCLSAPHQGGGDCSEEERDVKTVWGILLGFALMPATIGLIGLFAFLGIHFQLSRADSAIGAALGISVLIIVATAAIKIYGP
jgi:hypothetical protein